MKRFTTLALILLLAFGLAGCGGGNNNDSASASAALDTSEIKLGRVNYAPHGTKSFAVVVVAMAGDKIAAASMDEFQFMSKDVAAGVPNADALGEGEFATNFKDPSVVLASKMDNAEYYSKLMADKAGSKVALDENFAAIERFTVGKTVAELEKLIQDKSPEQLVDAVSGATLADTQGYLTAILEAAKTVR